MDHAEDRELWFFSGQVAPTTSWVYMHVSLSQIGADQLLIRWRREADAGCRIVRGVTLT